MNKKTQADSSAPIGCSGVTDTPAAIRNVQGTPDILAKLRARATRIAVAAEKNVELGRKEGNSTLFEIDLSYMRLSKLFIEWIDELAQPNDNTAPDTKSGIAGVP